jgi:hypothetical protein
MIDNNNWTYVYKLTNGYPCSTNVLYTPTTNLEKDKLCLHFTVDSEIYMNGSCVDRTDDLMTTFFYRELKYMTLFQEKKWCPTIYDVDESEKKILIEFNKESLNWPIYEPGRSIDSEYPNWKEDLFEIIKDIHESGYYKSSIYPHCFFYSKTGQLKMLDYYATIEKNDTKLHKNLIEPIIGVDSEHRFAEVKVGDYFEMADHFKNSMKFWIKWPGNPLPEFYDMIISNNQ